MRMFYGTYIVRSQDIGIRFDCLDESRESRRYVREICNRSSDDENLALWIFLPCHQVNDGLGILECVFRGGSSGVLSVVCQFVRKTQIGDCVCVNDACTTSCNL